MRLDVQGSLGVTDKGLLCLTTVTSLQILDVHRTQVSPGTLSGMRSTLVNLVSLGAWDDFGLMLEEGQPGLHELRASTLSQQQIELLPSYWSGLKCLELRNINQSYRLHRLGSLTSLSNLSVSGVHYRQSRLGVALLALSPRLTRLSLDHLNGLDTGDLRTIGQHCQALRGLRLSHCTVARSIHDPPVHPVAEAVGEGGAPRIRLFRALKHLIISSNIRWLSCWRFLLKFLLQPVPISGGDWPRSSTGVSPHGSLLLGVHSSSLPPAQVFLDSLSCS